MLVLFTLSALLQIQRKTINFTTTTQISNERWLAPECVVVRRQSFRSAVASFVSKHDVHVFVSQTYHTFSMYMATRRDVLLCFAILPATLQISNLSRFPLFRRAASRNVLFSKLVLTILTRLVSLTVHHCSRAMISMAWRTCMQYMAVVTRTLSYMVWRTRVS